MLLHGLLAGGSLISYIHNQKVDRIPLDLGSTMVTGIHASTYAQLREALGLKKEFIKIIDPFQMLAEVELEVIEKLGVDTIGLWLPTNAFGFKNENWKPWNLFDGTPVLVPEKFYIIKDKEGNLFIFSLKVISQFDLVQRCLVMVIILTF